MTDPEAALYRWFETFTLQPEANAEDPLFVLATTRRYVEQKRTGEVVVTDAGWNWFAVRSAVIIASCDAGAHDMRTKTAFCSAVHCQWCGHCDDNPCPDCHKTAVGGTLEGGWVEPLVPTHDTNPRSTISHGYES